MKAIKNKNRILLFLSFILCTYNLETYAQSYTPPFGDEFFVNLPATWEVPITLHPGKTVTFGTPTKIAFGVPIPRGAATNLSQIIIVDSNGQEISSHIKETVSWRSLSGNTSVNSIRSVLVYADVVFSNTDPVAIKLKYGANRNLELGTQSSVQSTWTNISNGLYPDEYPATETIMEPTVYATLPPEWLGACLIRTRNKPLYTDPDLHFMDEFYLNSSYTAVNDVDPSVTPNELVDYLKIDGVGSDEGADGYGPWLFDRVMTLYGIYFRTGDVKWLRHAHRASQFYSNHLSNSGYFDLKPCWDGGDEPCDLKYSYGKSLLTNLMFTGDVSHLQKIENIASAGASWDETYDFIPGNTRTWTARHQAYALLTALNAWETTGSSVHASRAIAVATASFNHALNPPNGWTPNGSLMTSWNSHEGFNGDDPLASPWMHALLADVVMQYYIHSEDENALIFLSNLGGYIENVATYEDQLHANWGRSYVLPYYLASEIVHHKDDGGWGDIEHTVDVAGIVNKAAWAKSLLGQDNTSTISIYNELLESSKFTLNGWHRANSDINHGKPPWRLSPPRKYNWWFGSTSDIGALSHNTVVLTTNKEITNNTISISPNPTHNIFTINMDNSTFKKGTIYNKLGQEVQQFTAHKADVSNLSDGLYFVRIISEKGEIFTKKVIKY